eukprot:CAMPEP_0116952248 /NCGR_PEP_ID=MMETSP0467-20121206/40618_1 /TAXON_ID=283647 /ORGANISM="Mesodinium pulex, Strain SPMC105" /LENGTH=47 /DNA_ID= /DNA_START= /DNA_END= /DNA_ORIENTATION=
MEVGSHQPLTRKSSPAECISSESWVGALIWNMTNQELPDSDEGHADE